MLLEKTPLEGWVARPNIKRLTTGKVLEARLGFVADEKPEHKFTFDPSNTKILKFFFFFGLRSSNLTYFDEFFIVS